MKQLLVLLCGLALSANNLTMAQTVTAYPVLKGSVQQAARPYKVGAGDTLTIHVYNQAELTQPEVLVAPDGTANFNTVGNLYVAGKSIPEIQEILRTAYSEMVRDPRVTVSLGRTRPGILYVAGEVVRPGMIQMATDPKSLTGGAGGQSNGFRAELRLTNALAAAGGLLGTADLSRVTIRRAETGTEEVYDVWKLLKDGDEKQDVLLNQNDTITVPALASAASMTDDDFKILVRSSVGPGTFPVRMLGYVKRPGLYDITGISPYLASAMTRAEGYDVGANRKMVVIRRFTNNHSFTTMIVNPEKLDVALRPNDIIWVPERRTYATARFFAQIGTVLSPFTNTATSAAIINQSLTD